MWVLLSSNPHIFAQWNFYKHSQPLRTNLHVVSVYQFMRVSLPTWCLFFPMDGVATSRTLCMTSLSWSHHQHRPTDLLFKMLRQGSYRGQCSADTRMGPRQEFAQQQNRQQLSSQQQRWRLHLLNMMTIFCHCLPTQHQAEVVVWTLVSLDMLLLVKITVLQIFLCSHCPNQPGKHSL